MNIRKAEARDLERIMEIFEAAKAYMHSHGNVNQWNGAYPQRELMSSEIECGHCFVVCNTDNVVGTFCLIFGEDPTYAVIEDGQWKNEAPYATIHRLASDGSAKGIGHACIEFCYNLLENLRADTHADNLTMQRLLEKEGFERCGIIHLKDGAPRIAYQKSNKLKNRLQGLVCPRFINESRYRQGHLRIINALEGTRILGVHIPELKALDAALRKEGKAEAVLEYFERQALTSSRADAADRLCYEEKLLWGLLLGRLKGSPEEIFSRVSAFVPYIANWAECDTFCCNAKWKFSDDGEALWNFLLPYWHSHNEFEVRFAAVTAMIRFLDDRHIDRTFEMVEGLSYDSISSSYTGMRIRPYYVKMAVAWLLATALAAAPEKTRAFVAGSTLPDDVVKLYVRKARESFRTRDVRAV
jgi:3-methyladenine DNA glycosylase AlkD